MSDIAERGTGLPLLVLETLFVHVHYASALILEHSSDPHVRRLAQACMWRDVWVHEAPREVRGRRAISFDWLDAIVQRGKPPPGRIRNMRIQMTGTRRAAMILGWRGYLEQHAPGVYIELMVRSPDASQLRGSFLSSPMFDLVSVGVMWFNVCSTFQGSGAHVLPAISNLVRLDILTTIMTENEWFETSMFPPTVVLIRIDTSWMTKSGRTLDFRHLSLLRDLTVVVNSGRRCSLDALLLPDTLKRLQIAESGLHIASNIVLPCQLEQL